MIITEIESVTKTKFRMYLDGEYVCMLYKTDLKSYGLEKGSEITDEIWSRLKEEVLLKRAKLRAMHLLTDMARTEEQLRQKLR